MHNTCHVNTYLYASVCVRVHAHSYTLLKDSQSKTFGGIFDWRASRRSIQLLLMCLLGSTWREGGENEHSGRARETEGNYVWIRRQPPWGDSFPRAGSLISGLCLPEVHRFCQLFLLGSIPVLVHTASKHVVGTGFHPSVSVAYTGEE